MKTIRTYKDLTDNEKRILERGGIDRQTYNRRVSTHWSEEDALFLPSKFRLRDGEISYKLEFYTQTFWVLPRHYYRMQMNGLDEDIILKRIANGAANLNEAVERKKGLSRYDIPIHIREARQKREKATIFNTNNLKQIPYAELLFQQSCKQFLEVK